MAGAVFGGRPQNGLAGLTKGSAAACRNLPCPSAAARELWGRSQTTQESVQDPHGNEEEVEEVPGVSDPLKPHRFHPKEHLHKENHVEEAVANEPPDMVLGFFF